MPVIWIGCSSRMVQLLRGAAWGTLCRGCPGHLLVHGEQHLQHILTEYAQHYNHYRTPPGMRPNTPPERGRAIDVTARIKRRRAVQGLISKYRIAA